MRVASIPRLDKLFELAAEQEAQAGAFIVRARLTEIVQGFPDFSTLDQFTEAMVATTLNPDEIKQALGHVHMAQRTVTRLGTLPKREFLGRLQTVFKKLKPSLTILREAQAFLKRIPDPTASYTVCLSGYPNAGKSTLLKKLTGAKVEIAAYEFTTKNLNYGSLTVKHFPVQIVDTPGTLNREKINNIELQALLALKHLADAIVYVYDPQRDEQDQKALFETLRQYGVPLAIYAAKQDVEAKLPSFGGKTPVVKSPEELINWFSPLVIKDALL